jgi:hypothetical protein
MHKVNKPGSSLLRENLPAIRENIPKYKILPCVNLYQRKQNSGCAKYFSRQTNGSFIDFRKTQVSLIADRILICKSTKRMMRESDTKSNYAIR